MGNDILSENQWVKLCFKKVNLERKAMIKLDSILKSKNITLPAKVCLIKAMVFPVVMYGFESWTIKKAEHHRIDTFELKGIQPVYPKGISP